MRRPDTSRTDPCADALGRIDAYLDGDLAPADARALEAHCAACPACADELALAHAVQAALHAWTTPPCPDRVVDAALSEIRTRRARALVRHARNAGAALIRPMWRPALALATAGAVVVGLLVLRPASPEPETYTQAEIDQAVADAQRTLAILSDVGHRTGLIVRDDVLEPHVIAPVQRTVDDVLDP